jgi:CRP-like cAMP-binding protein
VDGLGGVTGRPNRLLRALPPAQRNRLAGELKRVALAPRTVLFEPGQHIEVVDFPRTCVVSLVTPLHDGRTAEVASVGNEGIVGVPVVIGGSLAVRGICSVGGWVDRMEASTFTREVENDVNLHAVVDDYLRAVFSQLSQAVACNRLHATEERLARWLLASSDHLDADVFTITYALLAQLLGSKRATVGRSAQHLRAAGLISYQRGRITIVDRDGLDAVACECYRAIRTELDGFVQRAAVRFNMQAAPSPAPGLT